MKKYKIYFNAFFDVTSLRYMTIQYIKELFGNIDFTIEHWQITSRHKRWIIYDKYDHIDMDLLVEKMKADRWIEDVYYKVYLTQERAQAYRIDFSAGRVGDTLKRELLIIN